MLSEEAFMKILVLKSRKISVKMATSKLPSALISGFGLKQRLAELLPSLF
jgi:hypothetical protein